MPGTLASLIPSPLHPAVVHLPMALAVLAPIFSVGAVVAVRRGARPLKSWSLAVAMFLALSASAWFSIETGEDQEERVERVVSEAVLDSHANAAENFLWLSIGVLGVAAVGLLNGRIGTTGRIIATAGSALLLVAGYRVGHSGGELVYTHGAASAYVDSTAALPASATSEQANGDGIRRDDRR